MATEWYYQEMGNELGPFSSTEFRQRARQGKITAETLIRKGDQSKWIKASRVNGLLEPEAFKIIPEAVQNNGAPPKSKPERKRVKYEPEPSQFPVSLVMLIVGLAAGIGGYWYYTNKIAPPPQVVQKPVAKAAQRAAPAEEKAAPPAPEPPLPVLPSAEDSFEAFVASKARRLQGTSLNVGNTATWNIGRFDYELIATGAGHECRISFPLSLKSKAILEQVREVEAGDIAKQKQLDRKKSDQFVVSKIKNYTDTWSGTATALYTFNGAGWDIASFEWTFQDLYGETLKQNDWSAEPELYTAIK